MLLFGFFFLIAMICRYVGKVMKFIVTSCVKSVDMFYLYRFSLVNVNGFYFYSKKLDVYYFCELFAMTLSW